MTRHKKDVSFCSRKGTQLTVVSGTGTEGGLYLPREVPFSNRYGSITAVSSHPAEEHLSGFLFLHAPPSPISPSTFIWLTPFHSRGRRPGPRGLL